MSRIFNVSLTLDEWKVIHRFLIENFNDNLNIIQEIENQVPEIKNE